jgi:hypothetical protein
MNDQQPVGGFSHEKHPVASGQRAPVPHHGRQPHVALPGHGQSADVDRRGRHCAHQPPCEQDGVPVPRPGVDHGIDGETELVADGNALNQVIMVQSKASTRHGVVQAGPDLGLSWPTVMNAVTTHARAVLPEQPGPVECWAWTRPGGDGRGTGRPGYRRVGDDRRPVARRVRRHQRRPGATRRGRRTHRHGRRRLDQRPKQWRDQVRYGAIDMRGVFASAITTGLPHARIVVGHFHVVQLANKAVDEVRCRITTQLRGRRGRKGDGERDVRNLLTRNHENLSPRRFARMERPDRPRPARRRDPDRLARSARWATEALPRSAHRRAHRRAAPPAGAGGSAWTGSVLALPPGIRRLRDPGGVPKAATRWPGGRSEPGPPPAPAAPETPAPA